MAESQKPNAKEDQPFDAENGNGEDVESRPGDYYYDDSTGYEVYDEEDEEEAE